MLLSLIFAEPWITVSSSTIISLLCTCIWAQDPERKQTIQIRRQHLGTGPRTKTNTPDTWTAFGPRTQNENNQDKAQHRKLKRWATRTPSKNRGCTQLLQWHLEKSTIHILFDKTTDSDFLGILYTAVFV
jgi:hypothetical protein